MKNIKFLFLAFLMLFMVSCSDKKSLNDVSTNQSGKITILFLTQNGCNSCDALKDIFKKAEVKKILDSDYEVKFIDISKADTLPKGLMEPFGTPTLYFLSPEGIELHKPLVGVKNQDDLIDILNQIKNDYKHKNTK